MSSAKTPPCATVNKAETVIEILEREGREGADIAGGVGAPYRRGLPSRAAAILGRKPFRMKKS